MSLHQVLRELRNPIAQSVLGHTPPTVKTSTLEECQGIATYLNNCEHTGTIYSYRVEPCIDTIDEGSNNLTKLKEAELEELFREFRLNEQWLEDYRDGLELFVNSQRLGIVWDDEEWFHQEILCYFCGKEGCKRCMPESMLTFEYFIKEIVPLKITKAQELMIKAIEEGKKDSLNSLRLPKSSILDDDFFSWRKG